MLSRRQFHRLMDFLLQRRADAVQLADVAQLDAFGVEFVQFAVDDRFQNTHQHPHFGAWTRPVLGRKGVNRQDFDAIFDARAQNAAQIFRPVTVSFGARQPARFRPAPVAIHDDGDMPRECAPSVISLVSRAQQRPYWLALR